MFTPFAFIKSAAAAPAPPAFDFVLAYTSSFVAYSVARKLSSTYTGSAFRVRKASDGTQQDIGFVDNILDTASLASFCGASNGHIVTWYDQSGNGVNQTGAGTGVGPLIWNGSTVITGSSGIPACSFNGTDQYFAQTTAFTSNKIAEVFSVCTIDAYTANGFLWCSPDNGYSYGPYETGGGAVSIVASSGARLGQQSVANSNIVLVDLLYNVGAGTNNSFLWIDGSQTNFTLDNPASPYNTSFLASSFTKTNIGRGPFGASFYTNGRMSEWILYNNVDTQRTNIRTNFDNFYNTY